MPEAQKRKGSAPVGLGNSLRYLRYRAVKRAGRHPLVQSMAAFENVVVEVRPGEQC